MSNNLLLLLLVKTTCSNSNNINDDDDDSIGDKCSDDDDHTMDLFRHLVHLRDSSHLGKTSPGKTRAAFLLERLLGAKQAVHPSGDQISGTGRRRRTMDTLDGPHVQAMKTTTVVEQAFKSSKKKIDWR